MENQNSTTTCRPVSALIKLINNKVSGYNCSVISRMAMRPVLKRVIESLDDDDVCKNELLNIWPEDSQSSITLQAVKKMSS